MEKNILEYDDIKEAIKYAKEMAFKEGFEEGIKEVSFDVAKKCLQKGISVEDISKITDLTIEEIKQIK